ncbi:MAG TPA: hypothetical protein V6D10_13570 [Trichocoleus sp.]|jgi:predicted ABC-type sugar transport system permease subunit
MDISVVQMKMTVFVLASILAAFAGVMMTSRSTAVATQISSTLLLNAIESVCLLNSQLAQSLILIQVRASRMKATRRRSSDASDPA